MKTMRMGAVIARSEATKQSSSAVGLLRFARNDRGSHDGLTGNRSIEPGARAAPGARPALGAASGPPPDEEARNGAAAAARRVDPGRRQAFDLLDLRERRHFGSLLHLQGSTPRREVAVRGG